MRGSVISTTSAIVESPVPFDEALLHESPFDASVFDKLMPDEPIMSDESIESESGGGETDSLFRFPFAPMSLNLAVAPGYRALHEQAAWFDLSARGRIRVTGEDRARLLHAMTTQNIEQLQPGEGCYTFFLNAQGRILGDAHVFCFADHFLLDTEPETHRKLYEHIDRYIIADDVTLEDVTESLDCVAIEGPAAEAALKSVASPIPARDHVSALWGDRVVARLSATGAGGFRIFLPATAKADLITVLGLAEASPEDTRLVRMEHGVPRYGEEISERYLVQETAQLQAVSFNKGCYLGQEIVERVRSRAQIHRILRAIQIDATEVPAAGVKVQAGGVDAGEIASAAFSPALGKVVAMAYLKIASAEPGTELSLGAARVRVF